jgi:hypothetical protein
MATRIPFGLREGRMVSVGEVPRGLACGAACPVCKVPLIARQGEVNEHHFAHSAGAECATALETALHLMAKQVLAETKQLVLPALTAEGRATAPDGEVVSVRYAHREAQVVTFDEVVLEPREGSIIPDARCTLKGRVCYVEFWVTHASTDAKRAELARRGIAAVEVRLRPGPSVNSKEGVRKVLGNVADDREWLWHPRAAEASEVARNQAEAQSVRDAERRAAQLVRTTSVLAYKPQYKTRYRRVYVPIRPAKAAARMPSPKLYLRCEVCKQLSEWANDLPPDYEPPCPSCGRAVGRDVVTLG